MTEANWYDRAFGSWYVRLYPHRDRSEAEAALETVAPWLPPGAPVLDVACGAGRHLEGLRARGFRATGIDRSAHLLALAAGRAGLRGTLVRGDMRALPFGAGTFGSVVTMFTSFGYFASREAHVALLAEYARVVRPGGTLVLDYLNAPHLREHLVPYSRRIVAEHQVEEERGLETHAGECFVVKTVTIRDGKGTLVERYREEVAVYEPETVPALLSEAGWRECARLGDYRGSAWSLGTPRLILIAQRGPVA